MEAFSARSDFFCDICGMERVTFDALQELLRDDRSVRRFDESRRLSADVITRIIGLTQLCASGRNLQPLRYRRVWREAECEALFPLLGWAGYYTDWAGPASGERPVAYIVQCVDEALTADPMCDDGLHLQAITLGARALGIGCCIIKSFPVQKLAATLGLPQGLTPRYVVAMGYQAEKVQLVPMPDDGNYRYYRGENDCQCVPKRSLDELIIIENNANGHD